MRVQGWKPKDIAWFCTSAITSCVWCPVLCGGHRALDIVEVCMQNKLHTAGSPDCMYLYAN